MYACACTGVAASQKKREIDYIPWLHVSKVAVDSRYFVIITKDNNLCE